MSLIINGSRANFFSRHGISTSGLVMLLDQSDPRSYGTVQDWKDISGNNVDMEQTTVDNQPSITVTEPVLAYLNKTTYINGVKTQSGGKASRTLDGTNDYMSQELIDDETGMTLLPDAALYTLLDGSAASQLPGTPADYISTDGTHVIVWKDSGGDVIAWGYPRVADAALSFGSELVIDGDFDNWTGDDLNHWAESFCDAAEDTGYISGSSAKVTTSAIGGDIRQDVALTVNKLYRFDFRYKNTVGDIALLRLYDINNNQSVGGPAGDLELPSTTDWSSLQTHYFVWPSGAGSLRVLLRGKSNGDIVWFDKVTLKEVTNLGTSAAHIWNTPSGGGAQNWTGTGSGDVNDPATMEVYKSDLNITGDMTVIMLVKPDDGNPSGPTVLISKFGTAGNRAFFLRLETSGNLRANFSADGTVLLAKETVAAVFPDGAQTSFTMIGFSYTAGSSVVIFKNGVVVASAGLTAASLFDSPYPFFVGAYEPSGSPDDFFAGDNSLTAVFNQAKNDAYHLSVYDALVSEGRLP